MRRGPSRMRPTMRVAGLMQVCDSDREIAPAAFASLMTSLREPSGGPAVDVRLFVVDDASKTRAGELLAESARTAGVEATLKVLSTPIGFRGSATRMMAAFAMAAADETTKG